MGYEHACLACGQGFHTIKGMNHHRHLSCEPEREKKILRMYKQGMSMKEIGRRVGLGITSVKKRLVRYCVRVRTANEQMEIDVQRRRAARAE